MDGTVENTLGVAVAAGIPVLIGMVFRWLQGVIGESNARLLASSARQAVLAVEERYLVSERSMTSREKREAAINLVSDELDKFGRGVIPTPMRHSKSVEVSRIVDAIEATVHDIFNSPEKQLAHSEALQRVRVSVAAQVRAEMEAEDRTHDSSEEAERVLNTLRSLGLRPKIAAGGQ